MRSSIAVIAKNPVVATIGFRADNYLNRFDEVCMAWRICAYSPHRACDRAAATS